MVGEVTVKIEGAAEMERLLKQLGPRTSQRVSNTALRAGARPILRRAKELVPQPGRGRGYATGALRDAITMIALRRVPPDVRRVLIGVQRPRSRIFHLIEFGTRHQEAQAFMRPSFDEKGAEALDQIGRVLGRGIEREALKLAGEVGTRRRRQA